MDVIHELLEDSGEAGEAIEVVNEEKIITTNSSPTSPITSPTTTTTTTTTTNDEPVFSMNVADYQLGAVIGFGSSAIVHMATFLPLSLQVAIKMIELDHFDRHRIDELRKEIQVMAFCKHPNLLGIHTSFVHESKLWIVTPFLAGGSCLDLMKTGFRTGFDEAAIATILQQALQGLQYLHEHGHIHRDVKCGNLLMAEDGLVQLADFGVSASLAEEGSGERRGVRKTYVGTPCWMAPEVMEFTRGYDFKADIWSFGITALELAYGHAPYAKFPPMKVIYLTLSGSPPTLDRKQCARKYSRAFKDMIDCCLQRDPSRRPSARALLKHPFFKAAAKKPSYLQETVLSKVPPVNLRDKSAQLKARGYVSSEVAAVVVDGEAVSGAGAVEEVMTEGAGEAEDEESWDFSLDSTGGVIAEEAEEDVVVDGKDSKDVAEDGKDVGEANEDITASSTDKATDKDLSVQSTTILSPASNLKQSRFIVDDDEATGAGTAVDTIDDPSATEGDEEDYHGRSTSPPSADPQSSSQSQAQPHHPTEVKKGRFSVLEAVESSADDEGAEVLNEEFGGEEPDAGEGDGQGETFKGFAGISRPPSGAHFMSVGVGLQGQVQGIQGQVLAQPMQPIPSIPYPLQQLQHPQHQHHTQHPYQLPPISQHHQQLDSLLQMNEYIRSQLLELKHQQEWLAMRTHATIHPVQVQPVHQQPSMPPSMPTSHSHPNLYQAHLYPPHPPRHVPLTSPPPVAYPNYHPSHHGHLPVSPVYPSYPVQPFESSLSSATPAASLADSSSSLALTSILRELEAIRRENEALKVTLQKQKE